MIHWRELRIAVVGKMAAGAIQFEPADMRGIDGRIAALDEFVLDEGFEDAAHESAAGHPQDQAAADELADGEEPQLLAEHTMIALFCFFQAVQIRIQVFLAEKS